MRRLDSGGARYQCMNDDLAVPAPESSGALFARPVGPIAEWPESSGYGQVECAGLLVLRVGF